MTQPFLTLKDLPKTPRVVLVRVDLNVPMQSGIVTDTTRIARLEKTLNYLTALNHRVVLLAHFGRPNGFNEVDSLRPVLKALQHCFPALFFHFCPATIGPVARGAIENLPPGHILLLENVRFDVGEEANDDVFTQSLASLGDIYINDAFSCAHRAHASTVGITRYLPSYAGFLMEEELDILGRTLTTPKHPVVAIVAGSKVSTKLDLLNNLMHKVDYVFIAGGMANTFLAAQGIDVGGSMAEPSMFDTARHLLERSKSGACKIILPIDGMAIKVIDTNPRPRLVTIGGNLASDDKIVDIGPQTITHIKTLLATCATVVWNGPLGIFEIPPLDAGTNAIAKEVAELTKAGKLTSIAGGGDTVSALMQQGYGKDFTYLSTAGGAFLEWLEGKDLPGVAALMNAAAAKNKSSVRL